MRFHHMCIVTSDIHEAVHFWRDLMGFDLVVDVMIIPDGPEPAPNIMASQRLLDDLYKVKGARSKLAVLNSKEGALIELLQPENPSVQKTPKENLRYGHTGIHELGLSTTNIDAFFQKVRAAGYETQTEYVWDSSTFGRTFLFYDKDGNLIQMWEGKDASQINWEEGGVKKVAAE